MKAEGFTYIEVLVGVVMLALFAGPLSYSYLISIQTRASAVKLEEASAYAEYLLKLIKGQMSEDITTQRDALGNRMINPSNEDQYGVIEYLRDVQESTERVRQTTLQALLGSKFDDVLFDTTHYAYEVAIWRMADVAVSGDFMLQVNSENLKKASRFYSDEDPAYQFSESYYSEVSDLGRFTLSEQMLKTFMDQTLRFIPKISSVDQKVQLLDIHTIVVNADGTLKAPQSFFNGLNIRIEEIKQRNEGGEVVAGYLFKNEFSNFSPEPEIAYRSVINLDVRNVLRDAQMEEITAYDHYTFKFVNTTDYPQIIRVIQNSYGDRTECEEKFNFVVEGNGEGVSGTSMIMRINDEVPYENYLIAIIVRDKLPVQGHPGKLVKQFLDIYSYGY